MKYFLFAIVLLLGLRADAQSFDIAKIEFKVYDVQGMKIGTGKIKAVSDTSMHFKPYSGKMREISFREIGMIKTNHTKGKGVLIGAATGAGLGLLIGSNIKMGNSFYFYSSEKENSKAENAVFGGLIGGLLGAGIGGLVDATNKHTYRIRGNRDDWDSFKAKLTGLPPVEVSSVDIDNPDENIQTDESSTDVFNPKDCFPHRKWELYETGTFGDSMK